MTSKINEREKGENMVFMAMKFFRFCPRLPELEEVITIVYEKGEAEMAREEYDNTPAWNALYEHPSYHGLPIWSSWMYENPGRRISGEEATALRAQIPTDYLQTNLSWLREQIARIKQNQQNALAELEQQEAALDLLLLQTGQQTYGKQTSYIRQCIKRTVNQQRNQLTKKMVHIKRHFRNCHEMLLLLARMRNYDVRVFDRSRNSERIVAVIAQDERTALRLAKTRVPEQFHEGDVTVITSQPIE